MVSGHVRTHVTFPLEVLHAGWDNIQLICIVNIGESECQPSNDTAFAAGLGAGADVVITEGLAWGSVPKFV